MKYYIWTIGCQMNKAESTDIENHLKFFGFQRTKVARDADLIVLNTCVVRQHAEDKVSGMLGYLKGIKSMKPDLNIAVTGCIVGSDIENLTRRFPHVDLFYKPGEYSCFTDWFDRTIRNNIHGPKELELYPATQVSAYIPIIQGCNNFCSYCIVPYRRGRERSRSPQEILHQVSGLMAGGTREIILLGQNVNAYGMDLDERIDLSDLLAMLNGLKGLYRIRFLTNHPKDMNLRLIKAIASLDKVCHHICLPLQAGDDRILAAMNRHYTARQYRKLISNIRNILPDVALSTDIIVGFPGESDDQFLNTYKAVEEIRFDTVHVASYSTRSETMAGKNYEDNIPYEAKMQRLLKIEELQKKTSAAINQNLLATSQEVLVEGKKGGKWYGRTYSDKLAFFSHPDDFTGKLVTVQINSSSPWALQGEAVL